jgi:hypothetical protein
VKYCQELMVSSAREGYENTLPCVVLCCARKRLGATCRPLSCMQPRSFAPQPCKLIDQSELLVVLLGNVCEGAPHRAGSSLTADRHPSVYTWHCDGGAKCGAESLRASSAVHWHPSRVPTSRPLEHLNRPSTAQLKGDSDYPLYYTVEQNTPDNPHNPHNFKMSHGNSKKQDPSPSLLGYERSKSLKKSRTGLASGSTSESPQQISTAAASITVLDGVAGLNPSSRAPTPSTHKLLKPMCFRISNVPPKWSREDLLIRLKSVDDSFDLSATDRLSLYPACSGRSQVALLNLMECSKYFQQLDPHRPHLIRGNPDLTVDSNFYGLTPLNSPEGDIIAEFVMPFHVSLSDTDGVLSSLVSLR